MEAITDSQVFKLMGNGMHRIQVGQLLIYILSHVRFRVTVLVCNDNFG